MTMCRESVPSIRETVKLLASLGCSALKINRATPQGEWLNEPEHFLTLQETYANCDRDYYGGTLD